MANKLKFVSLPDSSLARKRTQTFTFNHEKVVVPEAVKKFAKGKTYFIHTYGCQANYRDEEEMAGLLALAGYSKSETIEDADFILLNTCAVRENAEQKVFGQIGNLKAVKAKRKDIIIALCGCMVQQKHTIEYVIDKFKFVDIIFGTHNIASLLDFINEVVVNHVRLIDVKSAPTEINENLPSVRLSSFKAFVNISYGCDKFCTYCIVPYTRGKERSRKMEDILEECISLRDAGYQEITLLGQNVNAYGKDFKDGTNFATLLDKVADLGIPRVRFLTSHPWDFKDEMIDVIAKHDNLMKYIHLPVQAGNDDILRLMNRKYTRKEYLELVQRIRNKIPDVALSTDIIVGFPNETYEQFLDTVSLCKEVGYDSAFTFIYSPRKNTPAAEMVDNVTSKEKSRRFQELVKALEVSIKESSDKMIGNTYKVLIETVSDKNPEMMSGYTEKNKLVHVKGDESLIGKIINVKITESHLYSLIGEIVDE